jgi:hypothetical protein
LAGLLACIGVKRNLHMSFRNDEEKRSLGRHRSRWGDNINMDHKEVEWSGVNLTYLPEDIDKCFAFVNTAVRCTSVTAE